MPAVGINRNDPEIFENAIASIVDMTSILFAYNIGMSGFGLGVGVIYAMFDAFIVIWMRKPISRFAKSINPYRFRKKASPPVPVEGPAQPPEASTGGSGGGADGLIRQ